MALMTLLASDVNSGSAWTFSHNPASIERVHKKKFTHVEQTYTSWALFDWGFHTAESGLIGQRYILKWPVVRVTPDWTKFREFYESAQTVTWDPKEKAHTGGAKYEVIVVRLDGNDYGTNTIARELVELELEIRRVV